ncbi:MAG: molybdopterin-dependent oxidoreductase [Thermodesulfobacteriota bacterium]|nr:molybdopterin-dependent oxidoreductase [Thermodesulfobacteriota bacterium]
MKKSVYTMCGMCTVRCPIRVESENNNVTWIEGNPHLLNGALCARGTAGIALVKDQERPQQPLIRVGERGEGKWRAASWNEAYDYVADKLKGIRDKYGAESIVVSSRGGPWQNMYKTFCHAIGSPNYTNHDSTCGRNTHHASLSINGVGRKGFQYDIKNSKHLVLFGRNTFDALAISENRQILDMLDNGGRLTYVDVRQTMTSNKATRFFMVHPGTDYALTLGVLHQIIKEGAYDNEFVKKWVSGFSELCDFVEQYTPAWAAKECGVDEGAIKDFVQEINEDRPNIIFHPGWMLSRYNDSFYSSRALHIMNALMGSVEQQGGLLVPRGPGDCGKKGPNTLDCPKPDIERADGVGTKYTQFDKGPGLQQLNFEAITDGKPYPVKAWVAMRHDLFTCMPDPEKQKEILANCELLVSIDVHYSEYGWFSDVILPHSTFLERDNSIVVQKGPIPRLARRKRVIDPVSDTKPSWEIFKQLAERLGAGEYFPYNSIEELWDWQLKPTGYTIEDFDEKGFVPLTDTPIPPQPDNLEGKFKTPSGKMEIISGLLTEAGLESLKAYESPEKPPEGKFRLIYGRCGLHTHSHTQNNPLLNEMMPCNYLSINTAKAEGMGIKDGDFVDVIGGDGYTGTLPAHVTEFIDPEAVFMIHGFGRQIPKQTRTYNKGVSDQRLMSGLLDKMDKAGGGLNLCESFVSVRRSEKPPAE